MTPPLDIAALSAALAKMTPGPYGNDEVPGVWGEDGKGFV